MLKRKLIIHNIKCWLCGDIDETFIAATDNFISKSLFHFIWPEMAYLSSHDTSDLKYTVDLVHVTAYHLLMGYLMPKFDSSIDVWL